MKLKISSVFDKSFSGEILSKDRVVANVSNNLVSVVDEKRAPIFFIRNNDFNKWIEGRSFDSSRTNVRLMKRILNIRTGNSYEMALKFHAISLTDSYWCREKNEPNLTYQYVSSLTDRLHRSALFGEYVDYSDNNTPEISNLGSFEKCWKKENGVWTLKKLANENELISEVFVSCLCKELNLPRADYEYDELNRCVSSKNFLNKDENLEEMKDLLDEDIDFDLNYDVISQVNPKFTKQYLDILFVDAICYNFDRHTGNYGFIRDCNSGEFLSMAPNYDNNNALISKGFRENIMAPKAFLDEYKLFLNKHNYEFPKLNKDLILKVLSDCNKKLGSVSLDVGGYILKFVLNNYNYLEVL